MLQRILHPSGIRYQEIFRIFDAVDLYAKLQKLTEMKPVVVNPVITLEQLFDEFAQVTEDLHRRVIRDQIMVKLRRQTYPVLPFPSQLR